MDIFIRLHHAKGEKLFDFLNVGICCNVNKMIISPCHALMGSWFQMWFKLSMMWLENLRLVHDLIRGSLVNYTKKISMELVVVLFVGVKLIPHVTPTLGPSSFSFLTPFVILIEDHISLFLQCESWCYWKTFFIGEFLHLPTILLVTFIHHIF